MDDCGRRRRDGARVGDVAAVEGEAVRAVRLFGGGEVVVWSVSWCADGVLLSVFFFSLLGSALMRRAWARWLCSRRAMRRRD